MNRNFPVAAAVALAMTPIASHAHVIDFGLTTAGPPAPITVVGKLTTSDTPNSLGGFDVLSISGTVTDASGSEPISFLVPNPDPPTTATFSSPASGDAWTYDNVIYPTFPIVDNPGILFSASGYYFNVYTVGVTPYLSSDDPNGEYNPGQRILTGGVPEPSTWAMMALGFAALGFAG